MSEEVKNQLIALSLDIIDISEKYGKMGNKEIDILVTNMIANKKTGLIKKIYELGENISTLRNAVTKASLLSSVSVKAKSDEQSVTIASLPSESQKSQEQEVDPGVVEEEKNKVSKPRGRKTKDPVNEDKPVDIPAETKVKETAIVTENKVMEQPKQDKVPKKKPAKKQGETNTKDLVDTNEITSSTNEVDNTKQDTQPDDMQQPIHVRRKKIPIHIKTLVWNEYIGHDVNDNKCLCCKKEKINVRNFHCGHVIAESKGGDLTIKNLRPICAPCNQAMGTMSMNEFTKTFFGWEV